MDVADALRHALADRYVIERELGQGGMATVYLAHDLKHDRDVALKVLHPARVDTSGGARFLREIRTVAQLTHPHILPLLDSGSADGTLYYVMPFVEGESLRDRLERERQLPLADALRITGEVAEALDYAHGHGIIHRDIKPENILLEGGHAVVADFGIATAVTEAGSARLTEVGLAVGTPAYMSPEQAAGDATLDARSDLYSLGCVLYEMLGGETPYTASTPQALIAKKLNEPLPHLSVVRETVSPAVEEVIARALARVPADRFRTIREFADALTQAGAARATPWLPVRPRAVVVGVVALVAVLAVVARTAFRSGRVDPGLHVVLPFAERAGVGAAWITGEQVESLLYDAMARWGDLRMVGQIRAHDAWSQARDTVPTLRRALDVARRLGAGLLAWGETDPVGDSIVVRAGLYDVARGGAAVEEREVHLPRALAGVDAVGAKFGELAAELLLRRPATVPTGHESLGTSLLAAWRPYLAGLEALNRLEVARAESLFGLAVRADPGFARAHLALAEAADWGDRPVVEWLASARSAVAHGDRLTSARDSAMAWGMLALAEGRFQDACHQFRSALRRDSLDVSAWFGLGECLRRDTIVVHDRRTPGGWRFRSSYEGAVGAYRRALDIAPSFSVAFGAAAYDRLARLLVGERYLVRWGSAAAPDTGAFLAWPALDHDTLVFVPYRMDAALVLEPPASHGQAVERGRTMLGAVVQRWARTFPRNARAHAAWGRVLELQGQLSEERAGRASAVGQVREALRIERDPAARVHLALAEIRLRLKLSEIGAARRLADSLLATRGAADPEVAFDLACAAALVGRAHLTADLLARSVSDSSFRLPAGSPLDRLRPATEAALRLLGYASVGVPVESIVVMEARVDTLVRRWVDRRLQAGVRQSLLAYAQLHAFPTRGWGPLAGPPDGYFLSDAQRLLSRGDTDGARERLRDARRVQAGFTSGDVLPALAYQEAFVFAAVRDTAAAESFLDLSLENLPAAPTMLLGEPPQAAALGRAMALRSQLAARRQDPARARRWAAAVDTLWSGGDPEVRAMASRLQHP